MNRGTGDTQGLETAHDRQVKAESQLAVVLMPLVRCCRCRKNPEDRELNGRGGQCGSGRPQGCPWWTSKERPRSPEGAWARAGALVQQTEGRTAHGALGARGRLRRADGECCRQSRAPSKAGHPELSSCPGLRAASCGSRLCGQRLARVSAHGGRCCCPRPHAHIPHPAPELSSRSFFFPSLIFF